MMCCWKTETKKQLRVYNIDQQHKNNPHKSVIIVISFNGPSSRIIKEMDFVKIHGTRQNVSLRMDSPLRPLSERYSTVIWLTMRE